MHETWSLVSAARACSHEERAQTGGRQGPEHERRAAELEQQALAAEERARAAEHRLGEEEIRAEDEEAERGAGEREAERRRHEAEQKSRARLERRARREASGARRLRPGPGRVWSPGMPVSTERSEEDLDAEIQVIARALDEHGATDRHELARLVGARYWGPGRFRTALREAVNEGAARRLSRSTVGPPESRDGPNAAGSHR